MRTATFVRTGLIAAYSSSSSSFLLLNRNNKNYNNRHIGIRGGGSSSSNGSSSRTKNGCENKLNIGNTNILGSSSSSNIHHGTIHTRLAVVGRMLSSSSSSSSGTTKNMNTDRCGIDYPELVVFDLGA